MAASSTHATQDAQTAANKALVRRFIEHGFMAAMAGDPEAIHEYLHHDYVNHTPLGNHPGAHGREHMKETTQHVAAGMPDMKIHIHEIVAERDLVSVHYTAEATVTGRHRHRHGGETQLEPSGKTFKSSGLSLLRVRGGKIAESWIFNDELEELIRHGTLTVTPSAPAN